MWLWQFWLTWIPPSLFHTNIHLFWTLEADPALLCLQPALRETWLGGCIQTPCTSLGFGSFFILTGQAAWPGSIVFLLVILMGAAHLWPATASDGKTSHPGLLWVCACVSPPAWIRVHQQPQFEFIENHSKTILEHVSAALQHRHSLLYGFIKTLFSLMSLEFISLNSSNLLISEKNEQDYKSRLKKHAWNMIGC